MERLSPTLNSMNNPHYPLSAFFVQKKKRIIFVHLSICLESDLLGLHLWHVLGGCKHPGGVQQIMIKKLRWRAQSQKVNKVQFRIPNAWDSCKTSSHITFKLGFKAYWFCFLRVIYSSSSVKCWLAVPASFIVLNYCGRTKYFEGMYSQRQVLLYYLSLGWGERGLATA